MGDLKSELDNLLRSISEAAGGEQPGDYTGEDGLLYCGVCHTRKQGRIYPHGRELIVPVMCRCREADLEKRQAEDEKREERHRIDTLRNTSLMASKFKDASFDHYSHRADNEKQYRLAVRYAENFDQMYRRNQGLLIYGPVGTGKSYTAACIANYLLDRGTAVVMTSLVKILQEIQGGMDEGAYLKGLDNARLLILDDLGAERNTEYAMEKVYNVIDSRVRANKPMILTTNMTLAYMKDPKNIQYARIYDRIFENCYPVQMTGRSFRLDEGNRRYMEMQKLLEE